MSFDVIPQNLSITAMRSSGYKDTAHAVAELVDNSVQSGSEAHGKTTVELICVDQAPLAHGRPRISKIAVYDDAAGMDAEALRKALQFGNGSHLEKTSQHGIGKFGMGLPNSSISQCRRVDVWTWRNGEVLHSFLDVSEIENATMKVVPVPEPDIVPTEWLNMIASRIQSHGTLVVWSQLDRVTWKQSKTLLQHCERIVGRVYRKFISEGAATIRMASYEQAADGTLKPGYNSKVRPNDPLYLTAPSSSPAPYDEEPAFVVFGEPLPINVGFRGKEHQVMLTASICKPEVRLGGGEKPIGRHAAQNLGISIMRADRELELNRGFENSYDPRERWWGLQVEFGPELDDVFGVTNNKQAATGFVPRYLEEDAAGEGMTVDQYQNLLELDQDPRMPMYLITREIERLLKALRKEIRSMREIEKVEDQVEVIGTPTEIAATESVARRRALRGDNGLSDKQEAEGTESRARDITSQLEQDGVAHKFAEQIAVQYVSKSLKYRFRHADLGGTGFFDVRSVGGLMMITLNTAHPVHAHLFADMPNEGVADDAVEDPKQRNLLLLLAAWGRMEDEQGQAKLKSMMREFRQEWGTVSQDFFEELDD